MAFGARRLGAAIFSALVLLFVVAEGAPVKHAVQLREKLKHSLLQEPAARSPSASAAAQAQKGSAAIARTRLQSTIAAESAEVDVQGSSAAAAPHVWLASKASASTSLSLRAPSGVAAAGSTAHRGAGGTACQCICGDRVVWHRVIFQGDVKAKKEHECEHEVCPHIIIPGLQVVAECTYVADLQELMAGTLCQCQCGDKAAWRNRAFYGNVTEERERYCLEDLCPSISPVPGLRFEARCVFDQRLFQEPRVHTTLRPPLALPPVRSSHPRPPSPLLLSAAFAAAAAAAACAAAAPGRDA